MISLNDHTPDVGNLLTQTGTTQSLLEYTRALPAKLINAVSCILEDVAAKVRVFGITRTTKVPYISYLTHEGKSVSGFIKRSILSKFKGTHVAFNQGRMVVTDLATGEQTIPKLEYGDRIRVLVDRYQIGHKAALGVVLDVLPNGWAKVKIETGIFWYPIRQLLLVEKWWGWEPSADVLVDDDDNFESERRDWSKEPDEVVFAAAVEAKRDLGF